MKRDNHTAQRAFAVTSGTMDYAGSLKSREPCYGITERSRFSTWNLIKAQLRTVLARHIIYWDGVRHSDGRAGGLQESHCYRTLPQAVLVLPTLRYMWRSLLWMKKLERVPGRCLERARSHLALDKYELMHRPQPSRIKCCN
jgi:hypothetical protein